MPSREAVEQIQSIAASLESPPQTIPAFRRQVVTVQADTTIREVLGLIRENDFSQFPVSPDWHLRGAAHRKRITRWLAAHAAESEGGLALNVPVRSALREEETRRNVLFVSAATAVSEVLAAFRQQPLLEAVLITDTGEKDGPLLGIATQWDVLVGG